MAHCIKPYERLGCGIRKAASQHVAQWGLIVCRGGGGGGGGVGEGERGRCGFDFGFIVEAGFDDDADDFNFFEGGGWSIVLSVSCITTSSDMVMGRWVRGWWFPKKERIPQVLFSQHHLFRILKVRNSLEHRTSTTNMTNHFPLGISRCSLASCSLT